MKNNLIYKSNEIIEASYALSINEQRLLLACISQIKSDEEIENKYVISVEQARDLFYTKSDRDNAYRDLKEASRRLYERGIHMKSEDGRYEIFTRWVSTVEFDNNAQTATLHFHDQIKPYISRLKANFTKYRLKHITQLTSVYAVRVYELIVMWHSQNQSYKEYKIDEFKALLDLRDKYRQFGQLKQFVIAPAIEQINEHTDFHLEVSFRKVGRSYRYVQFRFNRKAEASEADASLERKKGFIQDQAKIDAEKLREAEFERFCENTMLKQGMIFEAVKNGQQFVLDSSLSFTHVINGRIEKFDELKIKRLIFEKQLRQVINPDDIDTKDIFS